MTHSAQSAGGPAPGEHLALLLARARNPFEISDTLARLLRGAVRCDVQLRVWRQHASPPPGLRCSTYQHTFTLADHSVVVLWELRHDTESDGQIAHEIYPDFAALQEAENRVHQRMGGGVPVEAERASALTPRLLAELGLPVPGPGHHSFPERESPDHARRLLRRASNADRPGEDVLRLLATARRHDITRVSQPFGPAGPRAFCSVYEHAFLLADGRETSLFELEHDFTPDGNLVCEVYTDETTASRAAERHVLAHGSGRGD
ncbi:DUF6227 family protein [Streptomyces sp. TRM 70351]|uniref:DUF6227 family protein n=1 Tax=Streptomyces sp. TRM 70351 TaxID=3116552 RepID=UPI002E7BAEBA|nr:DUF6227 family protein [Streptomyces sp. TRM 70351]MEE1927035.1 DUF6227 family protein [Streptomyces sp. TRM 70351]